MCTDRLFPTFLVLVISVLLLGGCGDGKGSSPEIAAGGAGGSKSVTTEDEEGSEVWFEMLLSRPFVPKMCVSLAPFPDGSGFMVLGRNGDVFVFDRPLESFEFSDRGSRAAEKGQRIESEGMVLKLPDVGGRKDIGSIAMVLDPEFSENHYFYVWHTDTEDEFVKLDRLTLKMGDAKGTLGSRVNVIKVHRRNPPKPYHMGGVLKFLPDGTLLIGIGDAERQELSQDKQDLNGKLIRIQPKPGPEGGYTVPEDNPYAGGRGNDAGIRPEIVAFGLRAPFRSYLHQGKHLVFGDVGSEWEEVDVWSGDSTRDFGWGRSHNADGPEVEDGVTPPILWWSAKKDWSHEDPDYDGATRIAVGVATVYDHEKDPYGGRLTGNLVFYDIARGWVRAGKLSDDLKVPEHRHIGHIQTIAEVVTGRDGYLYGLSYARPAGLWRMRPIDG